MWRGIRDYFIPRGVPRFERRSDLLVELLLTGWPLLLGLSLSLAMALADIGSAELRKAPSVIGLVLCGPVSVVRERKLREWARRHPGQRYKRG